MIDAFLSIVKPIDAPGSIPFLLIAVSLGLFVWFVWPRSRRVGRVWVSSVVALYVLLALPVVAGAISSGLPTVRSPSPASLGPLDALIVFDGDNRRGRVSAAQEAFTSSRPSVLWVLGLQADWIHQELPAHGVPEAVIQRDMTPGTTREQMDWVGAYARQHPHARVAIIASRLQLPRIAGLARARHLDAPIIGAPADREPTTTGLRGFIPSYFALRISRDGLYEHAALLYYRQRGWTAP